ncbi:MAG: porin family protein [Nitrospira sp.]|nr:porin family protein [Nitrospira sp.]
MIMRVLKRPVVLVALTVALGGMLYEGSAKPAAAEGLFDDMNIGLFSIGGRATYFDPKNGDENWFGGGQVRIHPFHFLAVEGSVDYRRTEINSTKVRTFPVQGSVLLYPFGMKRLSPFILGGAGWYFTNVEGPGDFDKTQHRFGAHAGGGLQLFLTEYVSLDGTYRHIWLEKIESKDASLRDKRFEDNGHMVTFGLNVHF